MKNFSGINFMAGLRKYSDQKTQFFAGLTIPFGKTIYQVQRNGASTFASASFFDDDLQGRYINSDGKSHLKLTKYFGPMHAGVDLSQSTSSIIFDAAVLRQHAKNASDRWGLHRSELHNADAGLLNAPLSLRGQ